MPEKPASEQQSFFNEDSQPQPEEFDSEATAAHIRDNATQYTPEDRTSEAAQDQGHGPYEKPLSATPAGAKAALEAAKARVAKRHKAEEEARMQKILDAGRRISEGLVDPHPYNRDK